MTNCVTLLSRQISKGLTKRENTGIVFSGKWLDFVSAANMAFAVVVIDHENDSSENRIGWYYIASFKDGDLEWACVCVCFFVCLIHENYSATLKKNCIWINLSNLQISDNSNLTVEGVFLRRVPWITVCIKLLNCYKHWVTSYLIIRYFVYQCCLL